MRLGICRTKLYQGGSLRGDSMPSVVLFLFHGSPPRPELPLHLHHRGRLGGRLRARISGRLRRSRTVEIVGIVVVVVIVVIGMVVIVVVGIGGNAMIVIGGNVMIEMVEKVGIVGIVEMDGMVEMVVVVFQKHPCFGKVGFVALETSGIVGMPKSFVGTPNSSGQMREHNPPVAA